MHRPRHPGQHVSYALELEVRRGALDIAIGVRDELGAQESNVDLEVDVGEG